LAIDGLAGEPRPPQCRPLHAPDATSELRRLRLDRWRIVYAVSDEVRWVWVLAVKRRPPYDYDDLPELLTRLAELRG
jgi:mRNA interferase RelE/StbE